MISLELCTAVTGDKGVKRTWFTIQLEEKKTTKKKKKRERHQPYLISNGPGGPGGGPGDGRGDGDGGCGGAGGAVLLVYAVLSPLVRRTPSMVPVQASESSVRASPTSMS